MAHGKQDFPETLGDTEMSARSNSYLGRIFVVLALFAGPAVARADTGLDFPGSAAVSTTMRFRFSNPLAIYPATYIWEAFPRQQPSYFTTFFWSNDGNFGWDNGRPNTYIGAHPYPQSGPGGGSHRWEIATDHGGDIVSPTPVEWDRWHTQALVAWEEPGGGKRTLFYWDLPDTSKVVDWTTASSYGNVNPPNPALTWGDAPWAPGNEVYNGILRAIRVYDTNLSLSDILSESGAPLSTSDGANHIWYMNMNPTPTDIADKSGAGNNPAWVGSERPALYQSGTTVAVPNPPEDLTVVE